MAAQIKGSINTKNLLPLLLACIAGFLLLSGLTSVTLDGPSLLIVHGIFEIISIVLGFVIFYITWYGTSTNNPHPHHCDQPGHYQRRHLGTGAHAVVSGNPGRPDGQHPHLGVGPGYSRVSSGPSACCTSLVCRLPTTAPPQLSNKSLLYCTLGAVAALVAYIVFSCNLFPSLAISSYDHPLAKFSQYAALAADLLALYILCRRYPNHVGKIPHVAILFGVFCDLSFSLAIHTPFSLNIAGHFFKVLANFYVLRSLYILVIRKPYDDVIKLKEEMEELADKNAKLYQESEHQRNMVEEVLANIGMIISKQLDVKETLEAIADMVADMMHARQSAIALFSRDRSCLQVAASFGFSSPPDIIPLENSLSAQVCNAKTSLFIDDLTLHPEIFRPQLIFANIRSVVSAPLVNDQGIIGVIEAYSSAKGAFSQRDALLLKALGHHAGGGGCRRLAL